MTEQRVFASLVALGATVLLVSRADAQSPVLRRSVISAAGGSATTGPVRLRFTFGEPVAGVVDNLPIVLNAGFWGGNGARICRADLDDGSGGGHPDGGVTIEDLLYFLDCYGNGLLCADLDDGSGLGNPDGGVTIDDLLFFLRRFDEGC